jgi:23S rRNA pseudouridine1911/1915/1917 synthase
MIKISIDDADKRIDKYLADKIKDYSRSRIQKLIKKGKVLVNKEIVTSHYFLRENDKIVIDYKEDEKEEKEIIKKKSGLFKLSDIIMEKTKEYFIINKPAGLIVHGADHIKEETLVDILLKKYPKLKKIGEDPMRPAIVHRIDKDVSGLMVIPRTQDSFDNLKKQFQNRTLTKEYTALVYGQIEKEQDEIRFPIKRSRDGYKMAALPETLKGEKDLQGAKRAISNFKVIERFINYTLVKVNIKTGRTHQIRVHMLAYGHPVVGDVLYNTRKTREKNEKFKLGRLFLVANRLSFNDLFEEQKEYNINLPDKLNKFLDKIK